jgi:hypothetical protein
MKLKPLAWETEHTDRKALVKRLGDLSGQAKALDGVEAQAGEGTSAGWTWALIKGEDSQPVQTVKALLEAVKSRAWIWDPRRWPSLGLLAGDIVLLTSPWQPGAAPFVGVNVYPECQGCTELSIASLDPLGQPVGKVWTGYLTQVKTVIRLME